MNAYSRGNVSAVRGNGELLLPFFIQKNIFFASYFLLLLKSAIFASNVTFIESNHFLLVNIRQSMRHCFV